MGTSTISTFIRISAPGRALVAAAPVAAGASAPAGAPVAGVVDAGGFTCTLLRGSSWPPVRLGAKSAPSIKAPIAILSAPGLRRLPCETMRRLGSVLIPRHLRLKAILARLTRGWRHVTVIDLSTNNHPLRLPKAPDVTGIQSTLCAVPPRHSMPWGTAGANPTDSMESKTPTWPASTHFEPGV